MRNRTEMVSNTGSDYEEENEEGEFEADDGSDDWKPEPEVSKPRDCRARLFVLVEMAALKQNKLSQKWSQRIVFQL